MTVEILPEHQWLQQMVGEWTSEMESDMGPGQEDVKSVGRESARSIGGAWVVSEGTGEMPCGGDITTTIMTLGYDPLKKKFVGTFIGSMMTYHWVYEGELSADGKVLTLDTEGPDFTVEGRIARYQDIIEFKSEDHRVMTSRTQGPDGEWTHFMTAHYHRVK